MVDGAVKVKGIYSCFSAIVEALVSMGTENLTIARSQRYDDDRDLVSVSVCRIREHV